MAQYVELYNQSHKTNKAIIVYKDNPAKSLPPSKDEESPDIVIGPWLQSESVNKYFKSLDYIFDRRILTSSIFYPQLLQEGNFRNSQTLLPVSFNLPAIIFASGDNSKIPDDFVLSLDDIRTAASEYNKKRSSGSYTKMGFVVTRNQDFLYLASKIYGVNFHKDGDKTRWNEQNFKTAIEKLSDWIETENRSIQTESDFAFKYLFMPDYRQVISNYTLFSYTTSARLFDILKDVDNIDYRWVANDGQIPIEDEFVTLGIYKHTRNQAGCTEFISWLFDSSNQDKILERKNDLNLDTEQFGFAGGFSSLVEVTEHIIPKYYTKLLSNLPPAQMLTAPDNFDSRWDDYKEAVIEPYLLESLKAYEKRGKNESEDGKTTAQLAPSVTIEDFEKDWRKKVFD